MLVFSKLNVKRVKYLQIMLLKKHYAFSYLLLILIFIGCTSKNENSFIISGTISNLENDYVILSQLENIQTKEVITIDTLKINKRGKFSAVYFLEPNIYNLTFSNNKTIQLAIDKGQHIKIQGTNLEDIQVLGSKDTQLLNDYETFRKKSLNTLVTSVRNKIKLLKTSENNELEIAKLRALEVDNYKKHLNELIEFIKEKMGTSIAIYPTSLRWNSEHLDILNEIVSNFEETHPELEITNKLLAKIEQLKKTSVGATIGAIKMPNNINKTISLDTIKAKYILIDFWASWCPPCRTESVTLNELYTSYNNKGFKIYGISLDTNKERWLKALKKDNRVWTNVSTLEGFKTPISKEYGITSLPTNILINSEKKIIAINIHGEELKQFIDNLYKE